ncbi:MAG TPA: hypothetical protein PLN21_05665 [Gemmatales bacterium]|nr:hypothetical protein [Gemmatales bacterium]
MNDWFSRNNLFDFMGIGLLCLMVPACQHQGEAITPSPPIDPKIVVTETPPKAFPADLVVRQEIPLPIASTHSTTPVPLVAPEELNIKLVSQPPKLDNTSLAQPVSLMPKRSGMSNALDSFLDHRNDEAIASLKQYPTDDQDIALVILPILARIEQGETWASLNGPQKLAFLESLRSLTKRLSKSAPLMLQNVVFTDGQPERYGEIKPRININYCPEDMVYAYAELVNLIDMPNADGDFNVRLEVTLELHGPNDNIFWKATKPFLKQSSISSRNDYHVTARFALPKTLAPGAYQLVLKVVDRDSNRTAWQTLPIQILDPKSKTTTPPKRKA